ncbi:MAG TPA: heterodisulfide reductase [Thermodesulforhabdus norvegica]|uniref:Heterodisulfide reductase n=1 Tax=Thermodesulforhabdus norvegica TaxID=39841 RepID=A0A7C1AXC3_9BACT|nr:heterodisulfide reductase [Thermodesulforhabdus norvegica]
MNLHMEIVDYSIAEEFFEKRGLSPLMCFQCTKCTNGCPLTFAMDIYPHQIIRFIHLGYLNRALASKTIWICSSCQTCTTRCPNGVDIAGIMDRLKELAVRKGRVNPLVEDIRLFHRIFLENVNKMGRIHEPSLMMLYILQPSVLRKKLKDGSLQRDILKGLELFKKGRMKILPIGVDGRRNGKQTRGGLESDEKSCHLSGMFSGRDCTRLLRFYKGGF